MLVLNIANLFYYYCLNIKKNKNLNLLQHIGKYILMLRLVFIKPTKSKVMKKLIFKDINDLIIGSLVGVAFGSLVIPDFANIYTLGAA